MPADPEQIAFPWITSQDQSRFPRACAPDMPIGSADNMTSATRRAGVRHACLFACQGRH